MHSSIEDGYLHCIAPLGDCTPSGAFMRELEDHGGQGPRFPLTHSLAPLSLEDWHDFQATASHHTLPQRALIPTLTISQGSAVRVSAAVWWKAGGTWLSQIG